MNRPANHRTARVASSLLAALSLCIGGCTEHTYFIARSSNAPVITLSTSVLSFGSIPLGQSSAQQTITLSNTGTGAAAFGGASLSGLNPGSFLTSSSCPATILQNTTCTLSVVFSPAASGALSATLSVTDTASNSPQLVALSGTGTSTGPVVSLTGTSLAFTSLPVGQAATQTVTLTNIGSGTLNLFGVTTSGPNATSFSPSGSCLTTATLNSGGSCFLTVTYAPTVTGSLSATLNINDNAPNTPQTIALASR